jgi:polysaccharide export outer membrane protein
MRIRFDYETTSRTQGKGSSFVLRTGDIVVVE